MQFSRIVLFVGALFVASSAQAANNSAPVDKVGMAILTARLLGASVLTAAGTILFSEKSPNVSGLGVGALLATVTMLAARLVCWADINKSGYTLPILETELPAELNWFNLTVGTCALGIYALYNHGGKLLEAYNKLAA